MWISLALGWIKSNSALGFQWCKGDQNLAPPNCGHCKCFLVVLEKFRVLCSTKCVAVVVRLLNRC